MFMKYAEDCCKQKQYSMKEVLLSLATGYLRNAQTVWTLRAPLHYFLNVFKLKQLKNQLIRCPDRPHLP